MLIGAGIGWDEIDSFAGGEARPDILGINHYLTSERFLDHRVDLYPGHEVGGNGRDTYVDAEAVRVKRLDATPASAPPPRSLGSATASPIAITEVHHGCHRDEQLRWFAEVWKTAQALREEGMDLRAVTDLVDVRQCRLALPAHSEERLLRHRRVRRARREPRPTVVAKAKAYAHGAGFRSPVLDARWWRRPPRLYPWNGGARRSPEGGARSITGATARWATPSPASARRALPYCLTSARSSTSRRGSIRAHRELSLGDHQHRRFRPRRRCRAGARRLSQWNTKDRPSSPRSAPKALFRSSPSPRTSCSTAKKANLIWRPTR
jgi:dTDP-4-dehydrorhamnose reductase